MVDIEEVFRLEGKVSAPGNFTVKLLQKIHKIDKAKEVVDFLFSFWIKLVIFLFISIDNFFTTRRKSGV